MNGVEPGVGRRPSSDRVLTPAQRRAAKEAFRTVLSHPGGVEPVGAEIERVPRGVSGARLLRVEGDSLHLTLEVRHRDIDMATRVRDVEGCDRHVDGEPTPLEALDDRYAGIASDYVGLSALMCGLTIDELADHSFGPLAFENAACIDGLLRFTFGFRVPEWVCRLYRGYEYEVAEAAGIPVDPSVEALVE